MIDPQALTGLGWSNHFQSQLTLDEFERSAPVRVTAVHRSGLDVVGTDGPRRGVDWRPSGDDGDGRATVGDWLVTDAATGRAERLLERRSLFRRRAPGTDRRWQLIAANVDTVFVVTSCNQDFNVARLERYLALAREADVTPVVVLTKADLVDDTAPLAAAARRSMAGVLVEAVNALDPDSIAVLKPWCGAGQTVALLGSSGVGKSTLINTLTGDAGIATAGIREDDAKGRHTTTGRSMHRLADGGWVIDTPGMRELQLADVESGIEEVFADIAALADTCRFADCRHESEPGCAVLAAVAAGDLEAARLERYRKLLREEAFNTESLQERRARGKKFGKMVKSIVADKRRERDG